MSKSTLRNIAGSGLRDLSIRPPAAGLKKEVGPDKIYVELCRLRALHL
jgi:hypothetical protein